MTVSVLIVEDEAPKRAGLLAFLSEKFSFCEIRQARSVRSAIKQIKLSLPTLVLLDMSLPTFDIGPNESGGRPQGFGGIEVLRYMDLYELVTATIVVTAYEAFSHDDRRMDHKDLDVQLRKDHPASYKGLIYYNSLFSQWQDELERNIRTELDALGGQK